ncbi:MAG: hypothetical protein AB7G11_02910 [Phycisphaerales bacterium]
MRFPHAIFCMILLAALASLPLTGCGSSYLVPGGPADMGAFGAPRAVRPSGTDPRVQVAMDRQPLASFPAGLAIAHVQESGYSCWNGSSYGTGRYSVVTQREVEQEQDLGRLTRLPMVAGVSSMSRLLLPSSLQSDVELRQAAASVHADMLLIYTFDTRFSKDDFASPLTVVTLGLFPSKTVEVRTTASALLVDTRSGYIYGTLESTSKPENQIANAWTSESAVDDARRRAEGAALASLMDEFEGLWGRVVTEYSARSWGAPVSPSASPASQPPRPQGAGWPAGPVYTTRER